MEIVFQSHHAKVSDRLRQLARRGLAKIGRRLTRAAIAVVRFEEDGPTRRVEIVLESARGRNLVAEGEGRYFGPALKAALAHLETRTARVHRRAKERARRVARP